MLTMENISLFAHHVEKYFYKWDEGRASVFNDVVDSTLQNIDDTDQECLIFVLKTALSVAQATDQQILDFDFECFPDWICQ